MEMERERRQWESDEWRDADRQKADEARRDEKIEVCCICLHPQRLLVICSV